MVTKTIVIDAKTKSAEQNVDSLKNSIDKLDNSSKNAKSSSTNLSEATKQLDSASGGLVGKFRSTIGVLQGVTTGFKTMGGAIASTGIGLLVIGITSLVAAFKSSEEGQNKFNKLMTIIAAITGNFVDLLADLGEKLIWVFENPKQAINDFADLIKQNIINRFEGLVELIPKLGQAINLLFKGEFTEAGKVAADAVGKVVLGVEDITDKVSEGIEAVKKFTKEQIEEGKAAAKVADMRAKADKIERDLIVKRSQLESKIAENRLKARQEDEYTAEQRKQFLLEAQDLENELLDRETKYLELRRDAQILENTFSRTNKENLDKEAQAIAAVNFQVAERAKTAKSLQRELNAINNQLEAEEKARQDALKQAEKEKNDFIKAQRDALAVDLESKARIEIEKTQEKYDELIEKAKSYGMETIELENARAIAIKTIEDNLAAEKQKLADEEKKRKQEEADAEKVLQDQKQQIVTGALNNLAGLVGTHTKFGKALAVANAVQDTYAAANKTLAAYPAPYNFIAAAGVTAAGLMNVKNILKTKTPTPPMGAGSTGAVPTSTPSLPPTFNVVGSSGSTQIADVLAQQSKTPVKAYVVSKEISTAQELDRSIQSEAKFG